MNAYSRNCVCYALGRFFATLGWQMLTVAVGWRVYALTHDPLALGFVGLSEFLPFVSLVLLGGHLADRVDRRTVVLWAYAIEVLCVTTLFGFTLRGGTQTGPIYALLAVFGATRAFWSPTVQAMLPSLVERDDFASAVALNSLLYQVAVVGGPVLGGLLYLAGATTVFASCVASMILGWMLMALIRADTRPAQPPELGSAQRFLEGLRFVWHNPLILSLISLDLFAVLFGGAVALLPIFASDILQTGPAGLGLLRAAPGMGAALAAVVLALRPIRDHAAGALLGGVGIFGLSMVIFGLSRNYPLSFAALVLSGGSDMVSVYIRAIVVPLHTPDPIRGRVSAVNSMFIGASNELGEFESGLTARWLGTVPSVVAGGVLTLAVAVCWAWWFPVLRRLRHLR